MIYKFLPDEAIKSIKDRVIHGVGIRFGSAETKDYDGEFFVPETETGLINGANRPFIMEHGYGRTFGVNKVADAVYEKSEGGWDYEATFLDTDIGNKAYNEVITRAYKSSAGAAGHTRRATMVKGAYQLDTWLVAEQSATLTPADSQNPRLTRTKSDYIMFALKEMLDESEDRIVQKVIEAFKSGEALEGLGILQKNMEEFKESFSSDFSVTDEVIQNLTAEFEQVNTPIQIVGV